MHPGDSGSGFLVKHPDYNVYYVRGVASSTFNTVKSIALFTDLQQSMDWIKDILETVEEPVTIITDPDPEPPSPIPQPPSPNPQPPSPNSQQCGVPTVPLGFTEAEQKTVLGDHRLDEKFS